MEDTIKKNKFVEFTYSILSENGEVIEQVEVPVNYVHGAKMGLWPKLEDALENKKVDDQVNVTFEPGEVFGEIDESLIFEDDIKNVPEEYRESPEILSIDLQDNGTYTFSVNEQANESRNRFLLENVRRERDLQLLNSDWTQLNNTTLDDAKKSEWETYRQKLRDLPSLVTPKNQDRVKMWITNQTNPIIYVGDNITFSNIQGYFTHGSPGICKSAEKYVIAETETYYSNIVSVTEKDEVSYWTSNTISHYEGNALSYYSNVVIYDGVNVYTNVQIEEYSNLEAEAQNNFTAIIKSNISPIEIEGYTPVISYSNISSDLYDANVHVDYTKVIESPASNVIEYSNITSTAYEALDSNLIVTPGYTSFYHEASNTSIRVEQYAALTPEQRTEYTIQKIPAVTSNLQSFYTPQTRTTGYELRYLDASGTLTDQANAVWKAIQVECTFPIS